MVILKVSEIHGLTLSLEDTVLGPSVLRVKPMFLFLYLLKMPENQRFLDVCSWYRNETLAENGLRFNYHGSVITILDTRCV